MKLTKLLFLPFVALLACSKSDSPPALQNQKVATVTVQTPAGLTTASASNDYAADVVSYVNLANAMSGYTTLFAMPASGATKSEHINGRVASSTVTYTWSDPQVGSVAYQVTDGGASYDWELFYKPAGTNQWLKYLHAYAMKDGSLGDLRVLDYTASDPTTVLLLYTWQKLNGVYYFSWADPSSKFQLEYNLTTKAGLVNYFEGSNSQATYKYQWGADGHGTWWSFDTGGTQTGTGTW